MNIALIAHDNRKELMVQFCTAYCGILAQHTLCATANTGKQVQEATGLPLLGVVPEDDALPLCMNRGVPILLADGQSAATAYRNIAKRLQGERVPLLRIR